VDSRDADPVLLQIGDVATRTDLSIKTIRRYDDVGLVTPSARSSAAFASTPVVTSHDCCPSAG
jgi:hypothetical protein